MYIYIKPPHLSKNKFKTSYYSNSSFNSLNPASFCSKLKTTYILCPTLPPMASCSKSKYLSLLLLLVLVLIGSCAATRQGKMMVDHDQRVYMNMEHTEELNLSKHHTGFRFRGQIFSFFPKGSPIPSSGPSKRHNSVVDSTPKN